MRVLNRLAGLLLAVVLIALGVFTLVQVALWAAGRAPWPAPLESWRDTLSSTELADRSVLTTSIVVLVAGLLLLLAQLRRVRPLRVRTTVTPVGSGGEGGTTTAGHLSTGDWWLQRRSVERQVRAAVGSVAGVHDVKAHAEGRPARWRLRVDADAPPDPQSQAQIEFTVRRELARLSVPDTVPVAVSVHHRRRVE
jgi:hypothetical protein